MFRLIVIALLILSFQLQSKTRKVDLYKALNLKLITVSATSLGGYQGFCIKMNLKNLDKDSLVLVVEAGTKLNSIEDKYQDILLTKEEIISLRKNEEKSITVKGYCCQATNCAPQLGSKYNLTKIADSNLVKLAKFLNVNKFENGVEQHAIWALSDCRMTANIVSANDELILPLKQFVSNLKGEKLPWYQIVSYTYVQRNGLMVVIPISLKGQMNYSVEKSDYGTLSVKNKNGMPVCFIKGYWLIPGPDQTYDLDIPLKELAKGKYTIELKTPEKQLAKQEFEI